MNTTTNGPTVAPFTIDVTDAALEDLRTRLDLTRLPSVVDETVVEQGVTLADVRELLRYWREDFDWSAQQARLNALPQVTVTTEDGVLHAVHQRAGREGAPAVMLLHGWPDTFARYAALVPLLVDAGYDVVVPSLPGTAWSSEPSGPATLADAGERLHGLMAALGYDRYEVHGGDWGAGVADAIAAAHPEALYALHLADVPFSKVFTIDRETASEAEKAYLERFEAFGADTGQGLYYTIQSEMPTIFSIGLTDSPVALAAWHLSRFMMWCEERPSLDDVLTNVMLHWVTDSTRSAMRFYAEGLAWDGGDDADWSADAGTDWAQAEGSQTEEAGTEQADTEEAADWGGDWTVTPIAVPTGIAAFPRDLAGVPPREYAERFYQVEQFTVMPRGGHFGALEDPTALAEDLRTFLARFATD